MKRRNPLWLIIGITLMYLVILLAYSNHILSVGFYVLSTLSIICWFFVVAVNYIIKDEKENAEWRKRMKKKL